MTEALSIEELNTFLPLTSLESLSDEEQKLRLQYWKEHFTGKEILEGLGTYKKKLYDLYKKHDVSTTSKQRKATTLQEKETSVDSQPNIIPDTIETPNILATSQSQNVIKVTPVAHIPSSLEPVESIEPCSIPESFHIHYAGVKSKEKMIQQLKSIASLLEEETHEQYEFSIQIHTTSQN
ncbi:hypothetical protein BK784_26480 [Bacillus thuringiensis serovar medellin]|uniref:Uncharacterized protein n=1 Tax=Bacillus thuringiensis subsp. medellin TaxID=79672 RepID=A0A9X6MVV4_BACTV|nr:hypothetical protein [Bacillus thuringiensis]OUB89773.1 hypothetical protein BK784_26480 [Bacillus thuringiensis serovar medellin]